MEVLDTHGEYVVDLLQDAINEHGLRITDKLIDSLDYRVERRDNDFCAANIISGLWACYRNSIPLLKVNACAVKQKNATNRHSFAGQKKGYAILCPYLYMVLSTAYSGAWLRNIPMPKLNA